MSKLAILFAVLAIASVANGAATVGTASPSSNYAIAPGNVFTNATDTTFTNLQSECVFSPGFDNTTNYVWCQTQSKTGTAPQDNIAQSWPDTGYTASYVSLSLQRRAINASSPSTKNATLDAKIATGITANDGGVFCGGVGYLGIAYGFGSGGSNAALQSDVSLYYIAVNATSGKTVKLTSAAATVRSKAKYCMYDNGIFYVIYTTDADSQTTPDRTKNTVMIQGVNVTSGAVVYNSTGGVLLLTGSSTTNLNFDNFALVPGNWSGYGSTVGILTYTDSSSTVAQSTCGTLTAGTAVTCGLTGITYKAMPITLATGAPGSAVALGTTSQTTTLLLGTETPAATTTTTKVTTTYGVAGGFGSFSTYGVVATKSVTTFSDKQTGSTPASITNFPTTTTVYSSSLYLNSSLALSTTVNMTNPTGYHLTGLTGYSTNNGFGIISTYSPDSSTATTTQVNLDTYYANGTAILSAQSLGTFDNGVTSLSPTVASYFIDAAGSPWIGYVTQNTGAAWTNLDLIAGYAGEIAVNILSANVLTNIFATLALMVVALFAF